MSPSEDTADKVKLVVTADPGTEIFIIDHAFQLKARGLERISEELSPGLYKIKFRAGLLMHEVFQVLNPGAGMVEVRAPRAPELMFSSPAPLATTGKTHEYHAEAARRLSREVHDSLGSGSQLFVFARSWTDQGEPQPGRAGEHQRPMRDPVPRAGHHPATGLTLHDMKGNLLINFELKGLCDIRVEDPWAGWNVTIDPGAYRLRVRTPKWGALEQVVVASPGWQTQVFLLQQNYGDETDSAFRADLASASILLSRMGRGFDPHSSDFRLAELARIGLTNDRAVFAGDYLDQMLWAKFENPMVGIFGAHALLSSSEPDRTLLSRVVENLRGLVGDHPDVNALALYLAKDTSGMHGRFDTPPMLRSSWSIVVDRAIRDPALVPAGSLASLISAHIWAHSAWLIWLADRVERTAPTEALVPLSEGVSRLTEIGRALDVDEQGRPKVIADLSDIEEALLSHVTRREHQATSRAERSFRTFRLEESPAPGPEEADSEDDPSSTAQRLAEALGMPPASVQATLGELLRKLGTRTGLGGQDR